MKRLLYIFILVAGVASAQDKLFFKDGSKRTGIILTTGKDFVFFKTTDTSAVEKIDKSNLLMLETYKGTRVLFKSGTKKDSVTSAGFRNSLGLQPLGFFLGRGTLVYERITADQKIGIVIPLTLSFDPSGVLFSSQFDTSGTTINRIPGVKWIVGADVNFYFGKKERSRFFIGPRFRYGTDVAFGNVEAYTLQTQIGWRVGRSNKRFVQHLSLGYGFAKILSIQGATLLYPDQVYPWGSLGYRIGFRW